MLKKIVYNNCIMTDTKLTPREFSKKYRVKQKWIADKLGYNKSTIYIRNIRNIALRDCEIEFLLNHIAA